MGLLDLGWKPEVCLATDNGGHFGFPGIAQAADGTLVVVARQGSAHVGGTSGVLQFFRRAPGSKVWTSSTTFSVAGVDLRDPALFTEADGTMWLSYFHYNGSTAVSKVARSLDGGVTWAEHGTLAAGFTNTTSRGTPISAGIFKIGTDYYAPVYGNDGGSDYSVLAKSTDGGVTWSRLSVIAQAAGINYQEPNIVVLPSGELLAVIRRDNGSGAGMENIWTARSADGGVTWTGLTQQFNGQGRPAPVQLADGRILVWYRGRWTADNGRTLLAWSADEGLTWTSGIDVDPTQLAWPRYAYAQAIPYGDGFALAICKEYTTIDKASLFFQEAQPYTEVTHFQYADRQPATLLGEWDGSVIQPVTINGWHDGAAVQPLDVGS